MAANPLEERYQTARSELSRLVRERNECLQRLETLAALPLSLSPGAAYVGEFDVQEALQLIDAIQQQTRSIESAMQSINQAAQELGYSAVLWMKMPGARNPDGNAEPAPA